MTYFLGRDVDVFLTLESKVTASGLAVDSNERVVLAANASATIPAMANGATVASGAILDLTGVDLSIGVSDEDVGPFFGQETTQSIELRKETTLTLTKKKNDSKFDVIFNGPCSGTQFMNASASDLIQAKRQGARFGINFSGAAMRMNDGLENPKLVTESGTTTASCYGYRLHVRMKDGTSGEVFVMRNAAFAGHTVSLSADGVQEETLEFSSMTAPIVHTPGDSSGTDFLTTLTPTEEM
jgi:hypothetical protein|tara:strand:- start:1712 stop:2431 length:720 start_codon:yes stop_codon:yes gene_type:complete